MNQLWAWEYEGKTEVGWKRCIGKSVFLYVVQDPLVRRAPYRVTDLRKVKVVDEDAVVIDLKKIPNARLKAQNTYEILRDQGYEATLICEVLKQLTPPITEPKNFGAIVEAGVKGLFGCRKWLLVGNYPNTLESMWQAADGKTRNWSSLINPIIISEGVEG